VQPLCFVLSRAGLAISAGSARAKLRIGFSQALPPFSLGGPGCGPGSFPEEIFMPADEESRMRCAKAGLLIKDRERLTRWGL